MSWVSSNKATVRSSRPVPSSLFVGFKQHVTKRSGFIESRDTEIQPKQMTKTHSRRWQTASAIGRVLLQTGICKGGQVAADAAGQESWLPCVFRRLMTYSIL